MRNTLFLGALIFVAMLALSGIGITWSPSYQDCHADHSNSTGENKKRYADNLIPISGGSMITCESYFANQNGAAITAISTVFLTIVTGLLAYLAGLQYITSRTQLRAFVFVPQIYHLYFIDDKAAQPVDPKEPRIVVGWEFRPTWQNAGETQTVHMSTHVEHEFSDKVLPDNFKFVDTHTHFGRMMLGPKSSNTGGATRTFTVQELADIQAGKRYLYLWGYTRYRDIFPRTKEHISRYCVQVNVLGDPSKSDCRFGYMIPNIGNCSDDECIVVGLS